MDPNQEGKNSLLDNLPQTEGLNPVKIMLETGSGKLSVMTQIGDEDQQIVTVDKNNQPSNVRDHMHVHLQIPIKELQIPDDVSVTHFVCVFPSDAALVTEVLPHLSEETRIFIVLDNAPNIIAFTRFWSQLRMRLSNVSVGRYWVPGDTLEKLFHTEHLRLFMDTWPKRQFLVLTNDADLVKKLAQELPEC